MQSNIANNRPITEEVPLIAVDGLHIIGERVLVSLGSQLGQRLLPQSPADGQRLRSYLAGQLAGSARSPAQSEQHN
jgi:hypothetical protein